MPIHKNQIFNRLNDYEQLITHIPLNEVDFFLTVYPPCRILWSVCDCRFIFPDIEVV